MRALSQRTAQIAVGVGLVGAALGFLSGPGASGGPPGVERAEAQAPRAAPRGRTFPGLDPRHHRAEDGVSVADLADGSTAVLSIHPGLQAHVAALYARYEVPSGALVAIEPRTGRVLAYLSHSMSPAAGDLVLDPAPPAASVFKIVTGAALVDAGVGPETSVCYHGGSSGLAEHHLEDDPARDRSCATLAEAMGGSINGIFAKLADRHIEAPTLERYASAFGFGHALPFDVVTQVSPAEVPEERLEYARTAAGFWHMHMSPLHAALIAATVANGGRMPRPTLVDAVLDPTGHRSYRAAPSIFRNVIPASTARALTAMMETTVTSGTARRHFFDDHRNPFLPGIAVAGKTGSLTASDPYRDYSWFVGFAPAEAPEIAVAALVVNEPRWRIKGAYAAREALRYWLVTRPAEEARAAREAEQRAAEASAAEAAP